MPTGLPVKLKVAAFAIGGFISKQTPEAVGKFLLFCLSVAVVIVNATPQKEDDAVMLILRPIVEQIANALKRMREDD